MKAQIVSTQSNAVNYDNKKELVNSWNVIVNSDDGLKNIITVRCYMGRSANASTVYAAIWVNTRGYYSSGKGKAGGYGYHKASAAVADAISSAGITLDADISGVGDGAIKEALSAIANALGFERVLIVEN